MTTLGKTRHEQDRPPIETREERLRFALAMRRTDWAHLAVPSSWRYLQDGQVSGTSKWTDAHSKREIRKSEILECIARAVEDDFGFTPSAAELDALYADVVTPARSQDAIHKFFHQCFVPAFTQELPLDDVWDRWRQWKPTERPRINQGGLIEAMQDRGYTVVLSDENGEGYVKGWKKRTPPLTVGSPRKRGAPRKEGN